MILVIDIGNTTSSFGVFENSKLIKSWYLPIDNFKKSNEHNLIVSSIKLNNIDINKVNGICISSVVPSVTGSFKVKCKEITNEILVVKDNDCKLDIETLRTNPREIGADILVNIFAGKKLFQKPFLIIDMGTATTFDLVNEKGIYVGSSFIPGIKGFLNALTQNCEQLQNIDIQSTELLIGKNTEEAIQSGIYNGYIGAIKNISNKIKKEHPNLNVCLTGGLGRLVDKTLVDGGVINFYYKDLTLEGLFHIWQYNQR